MSLTWIGRDVNVAFVVNLHAFSYASDFQHYANVETGRST